MPSTSPRPRGVSALFTALLLFVLVGLLALVVNVGHLMTTRAQLQNACDAAALAGAALLDGTSTGLQRARSEAVNYAARHVTDRAMSVALTTADVTFGSWEGEPGSLTPITETAPASDLRQINAVRVQAGREAQRGNALELFFSAFGLRNRSVDVRTSAVARGGGPCDDCAIPFIVTDCRIVTSCGLACGTQLTFSTDSTSDVGFTTVAAGQRSVSTTGIINSLAAGCRSARVGDVVGVGNGNNLNKQVVDALQIWITKNGSLASVPVMHATSCPAKITGTASIIGFSTFRISGLKSTPKPSVTLTLDCTQSTRTASGCGFFGRNAPPALVR